MNTSIKRIIAFLVSTVLSVVALGITVSAAGEAEFILPDEVKAGDSFSVSVKVTAEKEIGLVSATVTYDDSILEFKASDDARGGGSGVVNLQGFPEDVSSELTFKLNFRAKKNGDCGLNLTNCFITSPDGGQIGSPSAVAFLSVTGTASDNGTDSSDTEQKSTAERGCLKSLTVSEGVLKPQFSYDIYDYHVDVDSDVEKCEIGGVTANETDMIWYTGNEDLAVGDNVRTIKVTDEDGYSHVYTITITRAMTDSSSQQTDESVYESVDDTLQSESNVSDSSKLDIIEEKVDTFDKYRDIITAALIVILVALIIALIVLIVWLRNKSTGNKSHKSNTRNKR